MKIFVVTPTYNEKENIQLLIPRLQKVFLQLKKHDMHILVADDNSPDQTAEEVKKMQKKYKNLHLLSGQKQGLGVAYLRAFDYIIKKEHPDALIMMDADLSHDPKVITDFVQALEHGNDVVIGSRYVPGGSTPDWNIKRKIISRGGNFFARVIAGMYKVHDCTSGFRAFKVKTFKKVNISHLHTRGYAFLSTLLYELLSTGAKVKEVPIVFPDRTYGTTKLRRHDMIEFFFNAFRLRFKSSKRMIKFITVGGTGVFVNIGLLFTLVEIFGLNKTLISPLIAIELSILWNFFLNNIWTFRHNNNKHTLITRVFKFHLVAFSGMILNLIIYNSILFLDLFSWALGRFDYLGAQIIAIGIVFFWNYLVNTRWTWREKIE